MSKSAPGPYRVGHLQRVKGRQLVDPEGHDPPTGKSHGKMTCVARKEGRGAPHHGDEGPSQLMEAVNLGLGWPEQGQNVDVNLRELIHKGHQPGKEAPRRVGPGICRQPVVHRECVPLRADVVPNGSCTRGTAG